MCKITKMLGVIVCASGLGACASIVEGTSQEIAVNTKPPGASCELRRDGVVIGVVPKTPGTVTVKKTKQNINVVCEKDGFEQASFRNKSDFAGATAGNLLLGGIVGVAIDAASGASNKYDGEVNIVLQPVPAAEETDKPNEPTVAEANGKPVG
ncbi:MAG: hypothetical protein KDC18_10470 [Alphaproteobacteria bacterium]|nr:hypothetical protein [Alphaproteobacteria bacterium]MCB9929972.1 hypothetical protein [Alphaproteobacteria bacterium]